MDKTTGEDRIKVVSFDGGEDQMKLLEDGKIDGLIVQNPYGIGYATVVACARAVLGQGNEATVSTGYTWVRLRRCFISKKKCLKSVENGFQTFLYKNGCE